MLASNPVPAVGDGEVLARFIVSPRHVRPDGTVKHVEFVPYSHRALSVTRHLEATEPELWAEGREVARMRGKSLIARLDVVAMECRSNHLNVVPAPLKTDDVRILANPNHADIVDYPSAKQDQMAIAQAIVGKSKKAVYPPD